MLADRSQAKVFLYFKKPFAFLDAVVWCRKWFVWSCVILIHGRRKTAIGKMVMVSMVTKTEKL